MPSHDLTLDRLAALLDAYGARPERWPEAERDAARALIARVPAARALLDRAAALDDLLGRAPATEAPPELAARILAGVPQPVAAKVVTLPTRPRRAQLVAAIGFAAAATLAVWLVRRPVPQAALEPAAVAQLGQYDTPTDALLSEIDLDGDDTMPEFGCDDPEVNCDDRDLAQPRPAAMGPVAHEEWHA